MWLIYANENKNNTEINTRIMSIIGSIAFKYLPMLYLFCYIGLFYFIIYTCCFEIRG